MKALIRTTIRPAMALFAAFALSDGRAAGAAENFVAQGPSPILFGQTEGLTDNPVAGALNAVAAHPTNADILYVGGTNGGIWKSTDATASPPSWTNQTDDQPSQSIGDIVFDLADPNHETLVAGIGLFSSYGRIGGLREGLLRTTDGGQTWTSTGADLRTRNVAKLAVHGSRIVAAVNFADDFACSNIGVFRSTDTGASFERLTMNSAGIPAGVSTVVTADPGNPERMFAAVIFADVCDAATNGIYGSADGGASWSKVSDALMDATLTNDSGLTEIEFGSDGVVYVASTVDGTLAGVFRSADGGATWSAMELPGTFEPSFVGVHAGGQGYIHFSMAVDPTDSNIVYIGGDRQPLTDFGSFPNAIGARDYTGRLFRGNASFRFGSQWTPITHVGTAFFSAPHADSRDMAFDATGNLIETNDGGIYRRTLPASSMGDWFSMNGNLQITEAHDVAYDSNASVIFTGNQDTGTSQQQVPGEPVWETLQSADGGDVAVDTQSLAGAGLSIRYSSYQNLGAFNRRTFTSTNSLVEFSYVPLVVISGRPFSPQFKTPVIVNQVSSERLIIGGDEGVYESLDQGDTIAEIGPDIAINYGGGRAAGYGAVGNEDILYLGAGSEVYRRFFAGDALQALTLPEPRLYIRDLTLDRDDPAHMFYIDTDSLYRTTDSGETFVNSTGDLDLNAIGRLRAVQYVPGTAYDAVFIGGNRGVYVSTDNEAFLSWIPVATGAPNTPVFEFDYDAVADRLIIGTLGRGTFSLDQALASINLRPNAVPDLGVVETDASVNINVLGNDSDPDGTLDPTTVEITQPPANGDAVLDGTAGTVTYIPVPAYVGLDQFYYSVSDNEGRSSAATVVSVSVVSAGGDADGDGASDFTDNCTLASNPDQRDSDLDGYGNVCDADLNNDGAINALDLVLLKQVFFTDDANADFNGDGAVNAQDLIIMKATIFGSPGPSALAP